MTWHREFRYYTGGNRWKMRCRCDCGQNGRFYDISRHNVHALVDGISGCHRPWSGKDIALVIRPREF